MNIEVYYDLVMEESYRTTYKSNLIKKQIAKNSTETPMIVITNEPIRTKPSSTTQYTRAIVFRKKFLWNNGFFY